MDVDASERRPGRGGRGSHASGRAQRCAGRGRARGTGAHRGLAMRKPPELYVIQEPERLVARNVLPLKANVRATRGAVSLVDAPLPPERSWRDLIRHLTRYPAAPKPAGPRKR